MRPVEADGNKERLAPVAAEPRGEVDGDDEEDVGFAPLARNRETHNHYQQ